MAIAAAGFAAVALHGPIRQDPAYHQFADQRELLGIPNFWNVVSNLPILAAGLAGFLQIRSKKEQGILRKLRGAYLGFFAGAILVALGSAFYHLAPDNRTLAWDRLAMTITFMAFLSIVIGEHINANVGRRALPLFLAVGILSVILWRVTDARGYDDLRLYVIVQFLPVAVIPLIVILFPSALTRVSFIWAVLLAYAVGKVFEFFDWQIYGAIHISGHTLKHILVAAAIYFLALAAQKRLSRVPSTSVRE